jgi:hypothetical protein
LHVLTTAPDLNPPNQNYSQWRLGNHATLDDLLANVYLTLKGGMPAIINIRGSDHWVVVASIDADNDAVVAVQMLDSLYDDFNPGGASHTYMDICGLGSDGSTWWQPWSLSAANLASYEVAIGTVPPPTGLTNLAGRFVGIMYGQAPAGTVVITEKTKVARKKRPRPRGETQVDRVRAELGRFATEFAEERLARLLDPQLPLVLRQVRDIQARWAPYTLASGFRADLEQGFVAAFDPADDVLMHFRFLKGPQVTRSLQGDADEPLWWTREFGPSLPSPYFPYRRSTEDGQVVFKRVIDGEALIQASTSI